MTSRHLVPPESQKDRTERSRTDRRLATQTVVCAVALSVGLLGATLACRADDPAPGEPTNITEKEPLPGVIEIDLDGPEDGPPPNIAAIRIQRGQVAQINCRSNTVWVMIPSRYFAEAGGGSDWAFGQEMIAFKIDRGFARVKLSEDFPSSDEDQSVYFSVLYFNGQTFYYQRGESPPRMIIPPSPLQ